MDLFLIQQNYLRFTSWGKVLYFFYVSNLFDCFCLRPKAKDLVITRVVVVVCCRRNYLSCGCSWIFCLIYALPTSTTVLPPIFFKYFKSVYLLIDLSINPSSTIFTVNLSINIFHSLNINI